MDTSFHDALKIWLKIGFLSFGGPAGQIALMHREFVDERKWLNEREFLSALNFCMVLPGPEAMQLATFIGWKLHGLKGGLAAGLLFILPGAFIILGLTMLYASFGHLTWIEALFYGVKAAVLAIVLEALLRVSKRALHGATDWSIAALAFLGLYCFALPFPLIIAAAAMFGFLREKPVPNTEHIAFPNARHALKVIAVWAVIWLAPLGAMAIFLGHDHIITDIGLFFSKLAIVTFGGAYAVLSYMAQAVVENKGWLQAEQMIDGLGIAETTPGPLILVTEFVGYLAAYQHFNSVAAGIAGALVTLWMTFAPCFLFIFAGAPYIDAIDQRPQLRSALSTITAAVVGVILNLSVWFGLHVLFDHVERLDLPIFRPWIPDWANLDLAALTLSLFSAYLLLSRRLGLIPTLGISATLGLVWHSFKFGI